MTIPDCVIIGGGGHAQVVIESLRDSGAAIPIAVVDIDSSRAGTSILDVPVVGGDEALDRMFQQGIRFFAMGIGGAANNRPRAQAFQRVRAWGFEPLTFIHPRAFVSAHARLSPGVQVLPGVVINANSTVAENTIVNSRAVIEHDTVVGAHCHIAPAACLCGAVRVGEGAHIGGGAVIRQGLTVGAWAIVGLGSVVLADVAATTTVVGNPAHPILQN